MLNVYVIAVDLYLAGKSVSNIASGEGTAWDYVNMLPLLTYAGGVARFVKSTGVVGKIQRTGRRVISSVQEVAGQFARKFDDFTNFAGGKIDEMLGFGRPQFAGAGYADNAVYAVRANHFEYLGPMVSNGTTHGIDDAVYVTHNASERTLLANRSAALQSRGGGVTRTQILDELTGLTRQGDEIASAIRSGDLELSVLGDELFAKAWRLKGGKGGAPQAFAYGEQLFVRGNSKNILSEVVHEGTHGLDYLRGFNGTVHQLEKRAYYFERQFQLAGGGDVEFATLDKMLRFILLEY
jgi:hypothetical protein